MNWRRGLFRLWIVGSALFVLAVAFVRYGDIKKEFDALDVWNSKPADDDFRPLVPQLCGDARGVAGTDYATTYRLPHPSDKSANPNPFDNCWYIMPEFRRLYPEYHSLSDDDLVRKLYPDHGLKVPLPNPWASVGTAAAIAFGIPLVVLVLGSSLVWAFSGFAARRT
jgi:hypothetical protein